MKKLALALMIGSILISNIAFANFACGFKPFKPFGCKNAQATCICDSTGNCEWIWICEN
jgi:hypothetical protein